MYRLGKVHDAFESGYSQGHDATVEGRYAPEEAVEDYMAPPVESRGVEDTDEVEYMPFSGEPDTVNRIIQNQGETPLVSVTSASSEGARYHRRR